MENIEVKIVPINSIFQDPKNPRTHSEDQLKTIAASLQRFSMQKPVIIDKNNTIVAGNGTHLAARDILGWQSIAVIQTNLSSEEARAYSIADNAIPSQSTWNLDSLSEHIKDLAEWNPLQDWNSIGFTPEVIEPILDNNAESELSQGLEDNSNALTSFLESNPTENTEKKPKMAKPIKVTEEQRELIEQGINIVRLQCQDMSISEGRCIELIVSDYIAGAIYEHSHAKEENIEDIEDI